MRKMWTDAIHVTHPDWVEIIAWSDFVEGTYVSPIDDPNKYQFANSLNLLPYFIKWYKTGQQPTITREAVYFAYRTQPASYDAGLPPVANKYGPVADVIYITPNLTEPATLKADTGSESKLDQPAGGQLGYWDAVPAGRSTQLRAAAERPGSVARFGERSESRPRPSTTTTTTTRRGT